MSRGLSHLASSPVGGLIWRPPTWQAVTWVGVLHGLWLFLPAYVANMSPVLSAKLVPGWSAPIDGGRTDAQGRPLLGPGKTWRGLLGGTIAGAATALLVAWAAPAFHGGGPLAGWDFGLGGYPGPPIGSDPTFCEPGGACAVVDAENAAWWAVLTFGAVVGAMALVGDAVKSYFKRRRGKPRGAPWFPFDQLDFVVFGLLGMALAAPVLPDGWVREALLGDWLVLATIVVLTPLLHFLVNVVGYWLKLKEVPW